MSKHDRENVFTDATAPQYTGVNGFGIKAELMFMAERRLETLDAVYTSRRRVPPRDTFISENVEQTMAGPEHEHAALRQATAESLRVKANARNGMRWYDLPRWISARRIEKAHSEQMERCRESEKRLAEKREKAVEDAGKSFETHCRKTLGFLQSKAGRGMRVEIMQLQRLVQLGEELAPEDCREPLTLMKTNASLEQVIRKAEQNLTDRIRKASGGEEPSPSCPETRPRLAMNS
ncbi:hypothetical protein ACTVH1_18165 [Gluconobacter cerinus]